MDIKSLIADLHANGVEFFEGYGIKIKFKTDSIRLKVQDMPNIDPDALKKGAEISSQTEMPTDPAFAQTMEAEMSPDKVLLWSANGASDDTPLTGDVPLGDH